jgi:hypothetical protein
VISTVIFGILVISLAAAIAVAGLFLVRRLTSLSLQEEHNAVAGFIYSGLAVVYAVVLGFVLITVWGRCEAASGRVDQEGAALAAIYGLASSLPDSDRRQVQQLAKSYAEVVID